MSKKKDKADRKIATAQQQAVARQQRAVIQQITAQAFSGPLPAPEDLARYEEVCPGAANRIITMAEGQNAHRISAEANFMSAAILNARLGTASALFVSFGGLALAGYVAYLGYPREAIGVVLTTLVSLVSAFLYGTRDERNEREARTRRMTGQN